MPFVGDATAVEGSVDAVVYEDGEFVGADKAGNFAYLSAEFHGVQSLIEEIQSMLSGTSLDLHDRLAQIVASPVEIVSERPLLERRRLAKLLLSRLDASGREQMGSLLAQVKSNSPVIAVRRP